MKTTAKEKFTKKKSTKRKSTERKSVAIVMGSQSDWPTMEQAKIALDALKVPNFAQVVSAHRTPEAMYKFSHEAEANGISVIIAGAGGAAHLPGMIASLTHLPVVGVPVIATKLDGLDSLLSIVQMPKGIPVATVAIENAYNAGLLAARILAVSDSELTKRLKSYQDQLKKKVKSMNRNLKRKKT